MQAEVDRFVTTTGVVKPDSGHNAPRQVLLNHCPILVQRMWPTVQAAVVVVGLLPFRSCPPRSTSTHLTADVASAHLASA